MKKIIVLAILVGLILNLSPVSIASIQNNKSSCVETPEQYVPHYTIRIYNDNNFTSENGVVSGSGSKDDPYIISGWEVDEIYVDGRSGTITKYFSIANCKILTRILLRNIENDKSKVINCEFELTTEVAQVWCYSDNVTVENCNFYVHKNGIWMMNASHLVVRYCNFYANNVFNSVSIFDGSPYKGHGLIENCHFFNCDVGIWCTNYAVIRNCSFENDSDEGIYIDGNYVLVENCTFSHDIMAIEFLNPVHNATIRNCSFVNEYYGIYVGNEWSGYLYDHTIENCRFERCCRCVAIGASQRITIRNCVFENSLSDTGQPVIELYGETTVVRDCKIYNNYFSNNKLVISIEPQVNGSVVDNLFFNNYFSGNTENVHGDAGAVALQQWNISKTLGTNIIGGPYLGGNYWENYTGTDNNSDGIGDTTYNILDGQIFDYLPLYNPPPEKPTINGPTNGTAGQTYNYTFVTTDPYENDVYYYINWGDCPGWIMQVGPYASGQEVTISHTFTNQGTFTIKAMAKDIYGAESDWGTLSVTMPLDLPGSQQSNPQSYPSQQSQPLVNILSSSSQQNTQPFSKSVITQQPAYSITNSINTPATTTTTITSTTPSVKTASK